MIKTFAPIPLATLLLTSMIFAQNSKLGAPGCGDPNTKFDSKPGKSGQTAQLEAGKALVYFFENDTDFESRPRPTTRIGVDGQWVGANKADSYFYISVDPGVHHLCASWQNAPIFAHGIETVAAHFTAEVGVAYYYEVKNKWSDEHRSPSMSLTQLDSDQGQLLATKLALSDSHPKK
ncbi:MAG: DUF2846 domain-containing protein [Acidobacteriota bacterium]|jgi:hypothetical protein|nr:DUF2846 domain-containing protein [Acidobacteriota bacterium]